MHRARIRSATDTRMSKTPIRAVSLWYGQDDRTRLEAGSITEQQYGYDVRIPEKDWQDADLPADVTDWCITVTTQDGEHINSEVAEHTHTPAASTLRLQTKPLIAHP